MQFTIQLDPSLGNLAMLLAMNQDEEHSLALLNQISDLGFQGLQGKVGAMNGEKIVASIETAAKRHKIIDSGLYRECHALYHAILDALQGVTRGQIVFGEVHRTVGLKFSILRGPGPAREKGEWIAVALYGNIGAPAKGFEHEVSGLGIFHI
ncbi:HutP family protein [Paenibacillus sp. KN14-4R]|uniref:HutP family protein n=1 Tax=Paenibacillus sp. KN14-4R TaxID=3445773 RepID=UPI003FA029FE